jgi:hypothetical protein
MMTEKHVPAKRAKPRRGEATKRTDGERTRSREARPAGVRKLVERQRETFNQVAKRRCGLAARTRAWPVGP